MNTWARTLTRGTLALTALLSSSGAWSQEDICAKVKIEIKQELTLERQAFDAEMNINNALENASLTEVGVTVRVMDEAGVPVGVTSDPNDTSAQFFVRVSSKQNISDVEGTGSVAPASTATINWLLIPAPGSAGTTPFGKKYLVGATLRYKFGTEIHTLDVSPDVITVKPLPLLTLDYFLTQEVVADDPFTPEFEPPEPFTLGVRVKNNGMAVAKSLKIDSAQPKIIENDKGLLISFLLTGSYLNDAPVQNTLLIDFGDIAGSTSKVGRWNMETSLAGTFTEFTAKFSHADELGGTLTSLLQATNAHFLIHDVRADLPGRDFVRDFLAKDDDGYRLYESEGLDTEVTDRSTQAVLRVQSGSSGTIYDLEIPPTAGYVYVKLPDPYNGEKVLGQVLRSDAKQMAAENVWLSKNRNRETNRWDYWVNFFDVNTPGTYRTEFQAPPSAPQPPVMQVIADQTVDEGQQVSFMVQASSPDGHSVGLSAAPLPAGATFTQQPTNPQTPSLGTAYFDWTPSSGQAGNYLITYTATDGAMSSSKSAFIKVEVPPPPIPGEPSIESPATGSTVTTPKPTLVARTSTSYRDRTAQLQFEIYRDEAMTQLAASGLVNKGVTTAGEGTTSFVPSSNLDDNHTHWWRVRAFDGVDIYSPWVNGRFFVNTYNDPPDTFNATAPAPDIEVGSATPQLSWTNSNDKDGDAILYKAYVYSENALAELVTASGNLPPTEGGMTSWTVDVPLVNHASYYWKVVAVDVHGAETHTIARAFTVNTGNAAPSVPIIVSPPDRGESQASSVALSVEQGTDADNDVISYVFEIDTVDTFDSGNKKISDPVIQGSGAVSWTVTDLIENQRYWWRVKAQDGRTETAWTVASFRKNAQNDAPPAPTVRNPGDGAWTASVQPTLEANPVVDPEEEAVSYDFEVYRGKDLNSLVASGTSSDIGWPVSPELTDKATHSWRVRTRDIHGATSAWSSKAVLYVSSGTYHNPSIQVTAPQQPMLPTQVGSQKKTTIRWEGNGPDLEYTVALYYSTSHGTYDGTLIVDGIHEEAGSHPGSYEWDVTELAPGAYYVYAVIYDPKGVDKKYAPGALVIPASPQNGSIVTSADGSNMKTSESRNSTTFTIQLGSAPTADVVLPLGSTNPREGQPAVSNVTFTAGNWSTPQTVTVNGMNDCVSDGNQTYAIRAGGAVTVDPNYIGIVGNSPTITNNDDLEPNGTTNSTSVRVCGYQIVSQRDIDLLTKEYVLSAELTNIGATGIKSVTATLTQAPPGSTIVDGTVEFGAAAVGETVKSADTFTIHSPPTTLTDFLVWFGLGITWNAQVSE